MSDFEKRSKILGKFFNQVQTSNDYDIVCLRATQIALGNEKITPADCLYKPTDKERKGTVSDELARSAAQYITCHHVVNNSTTPEDIETLVQRPRAAIRQEGYRQPTRTTGAFAIISPNKGNPDDDSHALALLPTSQLPRDKFREAKKFGASILLVDTSQQPHVFATMPKSVVKYLNDWRKMDYDVEIYTVGTDKKRR